MFVRELLREYLLVNTSVRSSETVRLMKLSVKHFDTFLEDEFGRQPPSGEKDIAVVEDLNDRNLCAYVQYRRSLEKAETTIERELAKLYTLARWACTEGMIPPLRSKPFKANVDPPIGFTPSELRRLFREAFRYDAAVSGVPGNVFMPAITYTFWDTLDRSGAVWSVQRIDVDVAGRWWIPRRGWIILRERKGKGRILRRRLRWTTTRLLRKLLAAHAHEEVFAIGKHRTALYYHWGRLLQRAKISDDRWHGPHCLRKTGISIIHRKGGNASEMADHADDRTTRVHYLVPEIVGEPQPLDKLGNPFGLLARLRAMVGMLCLFISGDVATHFNFVDGFQLL